MNPVTRNRISAAGLALALALFCDCSMAQRTTVLSLEQYRDRVQAVWTAQMLGAIMGWPFEHKVASAEWVHTLDPKFDHAPVDDDWYYEMVAIRAFENFGVNMTVKQLGQQWLENSAGSWGSSEQARILMSRGILPPDCGHPRYNKLWFTIGPQFSSDVYGAVAPGMPNLAGKLARTYGHINGYAEGVDGGVFIAALVSLGFSETSTQEIVKKAARLIHPSSPYRRCLDMVIDMAGNGKSATEIFDAVEDRWHMEYPATNNAVANGGIVAASLWFGGGDFLKTVNLAFAAADFTDADCNAANAAAVVGAMKGMKGLPQDLVKALGDSIIGEKMGKVTLTPAVKETISGLADRTAAIGLKLLQQNGTLVHNNRLEIPVQEISTQPAEVFSLSDLGQYWNPQWKLERAGFGGAGGGMQGIRGITYLDGEVLATYPRDEVKGVLLTRTLGITNQKQLSLEAGVDPQRSWQCLIYINNQKVFDKILEGTGGERTWYPITVDLPPFQNSPVTIRIYQRVLIPGKLAGNAYWKNLQVR
jgi:hypothetical protein